MSAAHELAERDIEVVVSSRARSPGARQGAFRCRDPGGGRRGISPAEHGFRFFPRLLSSPAGHHARGSVLRRPGAGGVRRTWSATREVQLARRGIEPRSSPRRTSLFARRPRAGLRVSAGSGDDVRNPRPGSGQVRQHPVAPADQLRGTAFAEYEHQSWWEFSGAQTRSPEYGKFLADGLTRTLVAAKARGDECSHRGLDPAAAAVRSRPVRGVRSTECSADRPTTSGSIRGWHTCARWEWTTGPGIRSRPSTRAVTASPTSASSPTADPWRTRRTFT